MPFKKGISGNPNGQPKKGFSITAIMKDYLNGTIMNEKEEVISRKQILVMRLFELAMKGDIKAIQHVLNYCEGMPKQRIEIEQGDISKNPIYLAIKELTGKNDNTENIDNGNTDVKPETT